MTLRPRLLSLLHTCAEKEKKTRKVKRAKSRDVTLRPRLLYVDVC
jgi:hypothetical protein